jgi:hypothetical protein
VRSFGLASIQRTPVLYSQNQTVLYPISPVLANTTERRLGTPAASVGPNVGKTASIWFRAPD